jgi:aldehyde:ferredoxin oxidoreductase
MDGCFPGCNLRCTKGGWVTLASGAHAGRRVWVDGPEYETAAGFGSNLGVWNAEFTMEANWRCDNCGIDTITTAGVMAFLMECFQRGRLVEDDGEGLVLSWGDEVSALEFIHRLAHGTTDMARAGGRGMRELTDRVSSRQSVRAANDIRPELEKFAMQAKGLPFTFHRTHRSLSMQGSYAAARLIKADLLGAIPTFQEKARVRLGNDNMGVCKLPWVDVFNPESAARAGTDIHINPASQEIYADFYNGMPGTDLKWEDIFAQTDRAIGPTDDRLHEAECNDRDLGERLGKSPEELGGMATGRKRELLMECRKDELRRLVNAYYRERGWNFLGIPLPGTLERLGLWDFLNEEAQSIIAGLAAEDFG